MSTADMVISKGNLKQNLLEGTTILLTGGGEGIRYEACPWSKGSYRRDMNNFNASVECLYHPEI